MLFTYHFRFRHVSHTNARKRAKRKECICIWMRFIDFSYQNISTLYYLFGQHILQRICRKPDCIFVNILSSDIPIRLIIRSYLLMALLFLSTHVYDSHNTHATTVNSHKCIDVRMVVIQMWGIIYRYIYLNVYIFYSM